MSINELLSRGISAEVMSRSRMKLATIKRGAHAANDDGQRADRPSTGHAAAAVNRDAIERQEATKEFWFNKPHRQAKRLPAVIHRDA